jgi:hypothetical protein
MMIKQDLKDYVMDRISVDNCFHSDIEIENCFNLIIKRHIPLSSYDMNTYIVQWSVRDIDNI